MGIIEMEPVCETALLAVLPVFRLTVADDEPNAIVRVAHIDNASRKLMSFRAQFLAELDRAYELIQKLLDSISGGRSSFMDEDEYGDNLIKLLRLFDKYISDNVPGFDHRNALVRICHLFLGATSHSF
jgi:hypothetical protein